MDLIRRDEGEGEGKVEFYTVVLTGQSGMSQSGLSVLAGVDPKTLRNLEETLRISAPSEILEPFVGEDSTLRIIKIDDPVIEGKRQGNLKVYCYVRSLENLGSPEGKALVPTTRSCRMQICAKRPSLEKVRDNSSEAEQNSRQFSSWEFIAEDLNELQATKPYDVWEVYDEGISAYMTQWLGSKANQSMIQQYYQECVSELLSVE
jgi:hypothetical protein